MNWPRPLTGTNPLVGWLNSALASMRSCEIRPGVGYKIKKTPQGTALEILGVPGGPASGWNWFPQVNYDASSNYEVGKVVIVEPWSTAATTGYTDADSGLTVYSMPGIYVCTQAIPSPSGSYHSPQWPPPQTSPTPGAPLDYIDAKVYWLLIAQYPTQHYVVKTLSASDYYLANTYDGTNIGTQDFYIAKPKRLRNIASEVIDGTTISYSYVDDNNRTANDGTNSEDQVVYPRFKEHGGGPDTLSIIAAHCPANGTSVTAGGVPVFLEEFLPARVWAKKFV